MMARLARWMYWLALALFCAGCGAADAQSVHVTLALSGTSHDEVAAIYEMGAGIAKVRFAGNGNIRQRTWQVVGGGELSADGLTLSAHAGSRRIRIVMRAAIKDGEIDRTYTPLLPFGDGRAIAVYSEYLLPTSGGDVVVSDRAGSVRSGRALVRWQASDDATYIVVGKPRITDTPEFSLTQDEAVPAWVARYVKTNTKRILQTYASLTGVRPAHKPWILLVDTTGRSAKGIAFRGDSNPGMIRLGLLAHSWREDTEAMRTTLAVFLSHELFHMWNSQLWTVRGDGLEWLYEGGADAIAWETAAKLGLVSATRFQQARSEAFVRCTATAGDALSAKLSHGGRAPYHCGAALFEYAMLPDAGASELWKAIFARSRATRTYGREDFLAAIRDPVNQAQVTDLVVHDASWTASLDAATKVGRLQPLDEAAAANDGVAALLLDQLVIHAIVSDCDGGGDIGYESQVYQIGALPQCKRLKKDLVARRIAGIDMQRSPATAFAAASRECSQTGNLTLSELEGGQSVSLPCAGWSIGSTHYKIPTPISTGRPR